VSKRTAGSVSSPASPLQVSAGLLRRKCACGNHTPGGGSCEECKKKDEKPTVQRFASTSTSAPSASPQAPPVVGEVLRSSGRPLDGATRAFFEPRFQRDFSQVRVHEDAPAAQSARAVDAAAYAVGNRIVLDSDHAETQGGRKLPLLAHELAHVEQNGTSTALPSHLSVAAADSHEEHEADARASAIMRNEHASPVVSASRTLHRAPGTTPGWAGAKGINVGETANDGVRRIPVDKLDVGQQTANTPSGRAIVLVPPGFDPTKPAEVLVYFHGHGSGYSDAGGAPRDQSADHMSAQLKGSGRTQTLAILPQGNADSTFGMNAKKEKVFKTDDYVDAVLTSLEGMGALKPRPTVAGTIISGHSGAGELINEKLLGGAAGSALPAKLRAVELFDAINGPREFMALQSFLTTQLASDLHQVLALQTEAERLNYLKSSFRFRAHFSHDKETKTFYSQWHVGPVPADSKINDRRPIKKLIEEFFTTNATALGGAASPVTQAFEANYLVIDVGGQVGHEAVVGDGNRLMQALQAMPKLERGADRVPQIAPPVVAEALRTSGRPLGESERSWAEGHFHRDLGGVRIHDDTRAAGAARALQAQAYTVGRDIVFGAGRYAPGTSAGRGLLAHELTHVMQQGELTRSTPRTLPTPLPVGVPDDRWERQARSAEAPATRDEVAGLRVQRAPNGTVDAAMCEANKNPNPAQLGSCNYKEPENCATYEAWVRTFTLLKTFASTDTPGMTMPDGSTRKSPSNFQVIGGADEKADLDFQPASTPQKQAAPPTVPLKPGERFIDHPTDEWVKTCLPPNLRATAYQLPADCADIAMILRHVWLAAHHRTEMFGKWTLGDGAGRAAEGSVQQMISAEGSGTVAGMVAPYVGSDGKALRSFAALEPLLHPGDILVWSHFKKADVTFQGSRTGGHTHTVSDVRRDASGKMTQLILLQGNEPLFPAQKEEIHGFLGPKAAKPSFETLGEAPGRRIERETASESGLRIDHGTDQNVKRGKTTIPIWVWDDHTLLDVAGPPRTTRRPATQRRAGDKGDVPRRLTDWIAPLKQAGSGNFASMFEGMLYELRAKVEGGGSEPEAEVKQVGKAAGERARELDKRAGKASAGATVATHLQYTAAVIYDFTNSRDLATSRKLDSAYDLTTTMLLRHLYWLRDALQQAAGAAP